MNNPQQDRLAVTALRLAQDALARAYEHARACGYAPGSRQMQALQDAERHYQQIKHASAPRRSG